MRHAFLILVLWLALAQAPALAAAPMTLPDAVTFALAHDSTVSTQQAAVTLAQHNLALQRGVAYPTVNGSLQSWLAKSANFQGGYAVIGQTQQNVVSQNTAQVGITNWDLTTGGFAFLALAATRAQERQAEKTLANTEDQIATNVTSSFYAIVQRQAIVEVDQVTLDYQNALVGVAKAKVRAGVAAGVDVLQALIRPPRVNRPWWPIVPRSKMRAKRSRSKLARRCRPSLRLKRRYRSRRFRMAAPIRSSQSPMPAAQMSQRRAKAFWQRSLRGAVGTSSCTRRSRSRLRSAINSRRRRRSHFRRPYARVPGQQLAAQLLGNRAPRLARLLVHSGDLNLYAASDRLQRAPQRASQRRCSTRLDRRYLSADAAPGESTCDKATGPRRQRFHS